MSSLSRRQALTLLLLSVACQKRQPTSAQVRRVVSLSPATTEAVFAIGAGERLVGRSRFCDFPPEVRQLPSVGGFVDPSFEAVLGLAPDLVIGVRGPSGPSIADRLESRGVRTFFPVTDSFADITAMLDGLGQHLSEQQKAGEVTDRIRSHRNRVAKALAGRQRPRALLVFGMRPIVAAGPGSFADEMLRLAGAKNVVDSARYPTLGIERVLSLDPDVIVDATGAASHDSEGVREDMPGWKDLRAIRDNSIVRLRDERVLRPGPRVSEGLAVLAKALHPGVSIET